MSGPEKHAVASPSGSVKWLNCPGSLRAEAGYPRDANKYAAEGTVAHMVSEQAHPLGLDAASFVGREMSADGFDFTVTDEMADHIQVYLDDLRKEEEENPESMAWLERRVRINEHCWGTADRILRGPAYVSIKDLKFGFNVVEPDTPQLKVYGVGALKDNEIAAAGEFPIEHVGCTIVQPRALHEEGPIRTVWYKAEDLREWERDVLEPAIEAGLADDAPFKAGLWCDKGYCKHRAQCPAYQAMQEEALKLQAVPLGQMSDADLGRVLDNGPGIKKWLQEAEKEALQRTQQGARIPGHAGDYKLVMGRKHMVFKKGAEAAAQKAFGIEAFSASLKSPAQIKKLGREGQNFVAEWGYTPEGLPQLAPADDSRPATKRVSAAKAFAEHTKGS